VVRVLDAEDVDFRAIVDAHGGVLHDEHTASFPSAVLACRCAAAAQEAARGRTRIGLAAGEVTLDDLGAAGREASRLSELARPGEALVDPIVRALADGHEGVAFDGDRIVWRPTTPGVLPFVGRARELAELRAAWDDIVDGRARVVAVSGGPGVGKSRLVAELIGSLDEAAPVIAGRCDEHVRAAYRPFVEAIEAHVPGDGGGGPLRALAAWDRAELGRLVPGLAASTPITPGDDPASERLRLFDAVAAALRTLGGGSATVLVVEDLHWADAPSLLLLRHLLRSQAIGPVLVVLTYREGDVPGDLPLHAVLADLQVELGVRHVRLGGLRRSEVAELVGSLGPPFTSAAAVDELWRLTDGNPFFVGELARDALERGGDIGVPESVREVVARRVDRLGEDARHLLQTMAVAGDRFELGLAEHAVDLPEGRLLDALDDVVAAGLVGEEAGTVPAYRFTHALVRDSLYEGLSATRRVQLHRRIGDVLRRTGPGGRTGDGAVARHLAAAATDAASADDAVTALLDAAARAGGQLAYEQAVVHDREALTLAERFELPHERVLDVRLALGDALLRAGERDAACDVFRAVAAGAVDPVQLARAALGFGGLGVAAVWVAVGEVDDELVGLLGRALDELGDAHLALRARLLARMATELYFSDRVEERGRLSEAAVALARDVGEPGPLLAALNSRHWALWNPDDAVERLTIADEMVAVAEAAADREMVLTGRTWRIVDLIELGRLDEADREIELHAAQAAELRQASYVWRSQCFKAMRALLEGDYALGEVLAVEALATGQRAQGDTAIQQFGTQLVVLRRDQGRLGELEDLIAGLADRYRTIPGWRAGLAYIYGQLGRLDDARREFGVLAADDFATLPRDGQWLPSIALLADVAAALDDRRRAAVLYDLLRPYADRIVVVGFGLASSGSASRHLGMLAATLGRFDEADALLAAAVAENERMRAWPWAAVTRVDRARVLLARGDAGDADAAVELLQSARAEADRLGMPALAARATALLDG
jgi:tetratricopeptide (TPR) repeat protein